MKPLDLHDVPPNSLFWKRLQWQLTYTVCLIGRIDVARTGLFGLTRQGQAFTISLVALEWGADSVPYCSPTQGCAFQPAPHAHRPFKKTENIAFPITNRFQQPIQSHPSAAEIKRIQIGCCRLLHRFTLST